MPDETPATPVTAELVSGQAFGQRVRREKEHAIKNRLGRTMEQRVFVKSRNYFREHMERTVEEAGIQAAELVWQQFCQKREEHLRMLFDLSQKSRSSPRKILHQNVLVISNEVAVLKTLTDSVLASKHPKMETFKVYTRFIAQFRLLLSDLRTTVKDLDRMRPPKRTRGSSLENVLGQAP